MAIGDFLKSGNKSASFLTIGTSHGGTVLSAESRQATDIKTGELKTWDDGKPIMQIVITVQTNERDPELEADDGKRGIYIKAYGDQLRELKRAVREAGDDDVREGGTFTATYVGDGEKTNKAFDAPKLFSYSYQKPSGAAALIKGADTTPAAAPAPAAPVDPAYAAYLAAQAAPAPAPAPEPTPAPAEVDPAYAAFLAYQASQSA